MDVAALLAAGLPEPPAPVLCRRQDGHALFYGGQVNSVFGDPESGKTWLAYAAACEALAESRRVLVVDADHNGAPQVLARLLALGAQPGALSDPARFRLAEPEDRTDLRDTVTEAVGWRPAVAVVDSLGEVLPILGLSSNSPDDYTDAHRIVLRPLALSGAAVVAVDHLAKSPDSRQAGPTGTAAKGRAVGGVSLRVTIREPFAPGRGGSAALSIRKDRPGGLRAVSPVVQRGEQPAGLFVLTPTTGGLSWHVTAPTEADALTSAEMSGRPVYAPTDDDLATVDALDPDQRSQRGIQRALGVGGTKALAILRAYRETADSRDFRALPERSPLPVPGGAGAGSADSTEQTLPGSAPGARERADQAATEAEPTLPVAAADERRLCVACGLPMTDLGDGYDTHPCCDPRAPGVGQDVRQHVAAPGNTPQHSDERTMTGDDRR